MKLRAARAEATRVSDDVRQEYESFVKYLDQRAANPVTTLLTLWNDMRATILGDKANEVFFVPRSDEIEIHTNRDPQRQIDLEKQELDKRTGRSH